MPFGTLSAHPLSARPHVDLRAFPHQLILFTHSLRGGPFFPGLYTTPLRIDGVVWEREKTGPPRNELVNTINS